MSKTSAGLLMFRYRDRRIEFLLVHPGGPFWKNKDLGAWTIPKGELLPNEDLLNCAQREFTEETGLIATGSFIELPPIQQKGGKVVYGWAFESDCDPSSIRSNTFKLEWPPRSGKLAEFPEVDRAAFFSLESALQKINSAQVSLLHATVRACDARR